VTYPGSFSPLCPNELFDSCDSLKHVCVPLDFDASSFCGWKVYCDSEQFANFSASHNHCFEVLVCDNATASVRKRANATAWEIHQVACMEFQCDNESRISSNSKCTSSQTCINDECVETTDFSSKYDWSTTLEIDDLDAVYLNSTKLLQTLSSGSGIDASKMRISTEVDERGKVTRVVVYLTDKQSAKDMADFANGCSKQTSSQE